MSFNSLFTVFSIDSFPLDTSSYSTVQDLGRCLNLAHLEAIAALEDQTVLQGYPEQPSCSTRVGWAVQDLTDFLKNLSCVFYTPVLSV